MKPLSSPTQPVSSPAPDKIRRHSRNGNVARLPKSVRDVINEMMRDGFSYPAIIKKLKTLKPPLPYKISESNLSNWKAGGYQDWLKGQLWLEQARARQEITLDMARDFDATQVNHGALQIVTLRFFEAMRDPTPGSLEQKLGCNLTVIYIDERQGDQLWLRALFTCRTEDWDFIKTVLFTFLRELQYVQAAGDASGLGRQVCWEAAEHFSGKFASVNFSSKKHDLGFNLMNQLSTAKKRFPRSQQDIAADYFALRKSYEANRWLFSESKNHLNPASHCDIAWAGALASDAHLSNRFEVWALVG